MGDGEGSTYVARDNSLWLADDAKDAVYEVNASTGRLKRVIGPAAFTAAPRFGGGPAAGAARIGDLESMAYNAAKDRLYAFSGSCCTASARPTAFRLTRTRGGYFRVDSFQPLPSATNFTAAAWNASDRRIYVGTRGVLRSYDYPTNVVGPRLRIGGVTGILGMGFSPDGAALYVVTNAERLYRVSWRTKRMVAGWVFELRPFGVRDSRAVDSIGGRLYVLDGAPRPKGHRLRNGVFVFGVA
jgi:sugar lactone lactonase YvrE